MGKIKKTVFFLEFCHFLHNSDCNFSVINGPIQKRFFQYTAPLYKLSVGISYLTFKSVPSAKGARHRILATVFYYIRYNITEKSEFTLECPVSAKKGRFGVADKNCRASFVISSLGLALERTRPQCQKIFSPFFL